MYLPDAFRESRPDVLHALIRENSFGTLVSTQDGQIEVTHLPFLLDPDRGPQGTLLGHVARANSQWRSFQGDLEVLTIFQGPHAYISPAWYGDHPSVPTWNYAAVHVYGVPHLIEDPAQAEQLLRRLVETYETASGTGWTMDLPADYLDGMVRAIVAFEIPIARIQGKLKLNQNRSTDDRKSVVSGLEQRGEQDSLGVASLMRVHTLDG